MSTLHTLPIIVVSAVDDTTATRIISELIDNDVTDSYYENSAQCQYVWRITNKYYTADVRVHAAPDGHPPGVDLEMIEAYLIHITQDELQEDEGYPSAARRARCAGGAWRDGGVRVVVAECAHEPPALAAWAGTARADLVPLRERAEPGEPVGWERARAALHAHTWRSLRRTDERALRHALHDGGTRAEELAVERAEELAVERAEAFAAALGALGPAVQRRGAAEGEARLDEAEALVRVFCQALGLDPESC